MDLGADVAQALAAEPAGGLPVDGVELAVVRSVMLAIGAVDGVTWELDGGLHIKTMSDARRDVVQGYATLLSATPVLGAYDDFIDDSDVNDPDETE